MGELIDIVDRLKRRKLESTIQNWNNDLYRQDVPEINVDEWIPVEFVDGLPTKYMNFKYRATIGYIPGNTDHVYLDYKHQVCSYLMSLEELVLGIETGTLPSPENTVT